MPTSVHFPANLLRAVDKLARKLKVSRNRLIVLAVENELARKEEWSEGFFDQLRNPDPELAGAVDEMMGAIRASRLR